MRTFARASHSSDVSDQRKRTQQKRASGASARTASPTMESRQTRIVIFLPNHPLQFAILEIEALLRGTQQGHFNATS
jgi:hypothetical protein